MVKWLASGHADLPLKQYLATRYPTETIYVSHGWIDAHVHLFSQARYHVALTDQDHMQGVVGLIDAGSSGVANLLAFFAEAERFAPREVFAFINLAPEGIKTKHELAAFDFDFARHRAALAHPRVVGTKARLSKEATQGTQAYFAPLARVQTLGAPTMVHLGNHPPVLADFWNQLKPGDIITHFYHNKTDDLIKCAQNAAARAKLSGLLADVGWGKESFSATQFQILRNLDFWPDIISTDMHNENVRARHMQLAAIMSYFFDQGMPLAKVVAAVTLTPYHKIITPRRWPTYLHTFTFFRVRSAPHVVHASDGDINVRRRIEPLGVQIAGKVYLC